MWTYSKSHVNIGQTTCDPTCDFAHVIFHMWFSVCDFPYVIFRMWCRMWFHTKSHVVITYGSNHIREITCDFEITYGNHMWFSVCDFPYVIYRMWFTACDLPHVIYRMWAHMWLSPIVTYGPYVITYGPYVIFRMWFWWPYVGPHVIITVCDPTCDHFFRWDAPLNWSQEKKKIPLALSRTPARNKI